ncbi:MAG TPA: thioredoxin-disulfide reductase [Syntrophorhabdus sp.]|nr:thioredoxin-disulfide reductase [Syntrophorhabdus sp.]HQO62960.1 thioredoxin-disulfide reductase [Syntrophorhabdus sp.]
MGEFHEAIIIGAGPAGLTAGIYLMRAGVESVLIEKGVMGGTPMNYEHVENYPGFPGGISSPELMQKMAEQAKRFGLPIKEFMEVEEVNSEGDRFIIKAGADSMESLGVIVCTGTVSVKMGIPGEEEFVGRGVSYCATCDGAFFRNLDVAVIGGGDAAIQEGLALTNIVRKVYVIHRRDQLRAQKIIQDRAFKNEKMEFLWNKVPVEIEGKDQVESILIEDTKTHERSRVKVDGVFVYVGARPNTQFLGNLVERDGAGFIVTDENLATKTAGLYVAGDARKKPLRQITTAVGDGALAAVSLEHYIMETR